MHILLASYCRLDSGKLPGNDVSVALPKIERDIHCVFEEILWVAWLAIKTNWAELFVSLLICTVVYLVVKRQSLQRSLLHIQNPALQLNAGEFKHLNDD